MNALTNSYSILTIAAGVALVSGLILLTNKPKVRDYVAFAVIILAMVSSWVILRPTQTLLMGEAAEVQKIIGAGKPVLLEFQSPFRIGCATVKPVVDELELELGDQIHFIRINIQEQVGKDLAPAYGFEFTPTFIYFDAAGNEVWRAVGIFDPQQVRDSIK